MEYNIIFKISDTEIHAVRPDGLTGLEWLQLNSPMLNRKHIFENTIKYEYFDCLVTKAFIDELPILLSTYPSALVIGVWKKDGLQLGWKYDISIDPVTQIETQTKVRDTYVDINGIVHNIVSYPFNSVEYIKQMPDSVVVDNNGVIISTSRPTIIEDVHQWSGWHTPKDFS